MSALKILHAADLHLDSPFEALPSGKAAVRRAEQRTMLSKLTELAVRERVDAVLLSGDLLDSDNTYYETGEELIQALRGIPAPVFIAPGNHDRYTEKSVYARLKFPENVYIFRKNEIETVTVSARGIRVHGAAFTESRSEALLTGFKCEKKDGFIDLLCLHGEVGNRYSSYNPITEEELANSGADYAALGHIHKASGLRRAGNTWYSWPGCPEGRGFDETGEHFVNLVELQDGNCVIEQVSIASRKYEVLNVDVTGTEPLLAVHTMLPEDTYRDIYRIVLTGETDDTPDIKALHDNLSDLFFELQLRDNTRLHTDLWEKAGENTLRGIFLAKLKEKYDSASEADRPGIEQAACWGLAALNNMEEVVRHED